MNALDMSKLGPYIFLIIPGFIGLKIYELLSKSEEKDYRKKLINIIVIGSINVSISELLIYLANLVSFFIDTSGMYFLSMFILPIVTSYIFFALRKTNFIQDRMPHPTKMPWDYVFSQREEYLVIISLKNNKKIAGYYGGNSFTSSYPDRNQIYLEQRFELDSEGNFSEKVKHTKGIMILSSDIDSVELFEPEKKRRELCPQTN